MKHTGGDVSQPLTMPAGVRPGPMLDWNRFFGTPDADPGWRERYDRFAALTGPAPMRWLLDLEVTIHPGDQISQAVYTSGMYEPCTADALRRLLRPGDTFADVGANVGLFTMLGSRWVGPGGRVISLEPSTREVARLRAHVERNALANVSIHQAAAGAAAGTAILHVAEGRYLGLNTLEAAFMYPGIREERTEEVPVVTLDGLLTPARTGRVAVVKIDVEGTEPQVVSGAVRLLERDHPALLVEIAGPALDPGHAGRRGMETSLRALGYVFAAIDGHTGAIRRIPDMAQAAENVIAALPPTLDVLLTHG